MKVYSLKKKINPPPWEIDRIEWEWSNLLPGSTDTLHFNVRRELNKKEGVESL